MKKKKWMMMAVMVLALTMMFGTTVYASGKGDVAGAIEGKTVRILDDPMYTG